MSPRPGPEIVSLGCRLNLSESDAIAAMLAGRNTVVVNTCAVTDAAVKQTRAAVRRLRARRPDAELIVTGCAAQVDPAAFAAMPEVDRVVGNPDKLDPAAWTSGARPRFAFDGAWRLPPSPAGPDRSRAFLEIQNGCDHACTFCVIPAGRGPARSAPLDAATAMAEAAVAAGQCELVLTGVDLTSWRDDAGRGLAAVVERLLGVAGVERLRLSSLDPAEVDEPLLDLIVGEPRVQPHLHLSLQAGNDMILKRMRRRHSQAQAVRLVERVKARRPEVAVGADLIAGFPTETEAMFADTLAAIADCDVVQAHVFPYSAKAGTPAARMPQVAMPVRRERAARLRAAAGARRAAWLWTLVGGEQRVLVERPGTHGHAGNFAEVRLAEPRIPGEVVRVRVTRASDTELEGVAL